MNDGQIVKLNSVNFTNSYLPLLVPDQQQTIVLKDRFVDIKLGAPA